MKAAKTLLVNTLMLSGTSLVLRGVGVFFQLYVAQRLGSAGMGLLQLATSVYAFAVTVATSGMKLTATRIIAEELGRGGAGVRCAVQRCFLFAAVTGAAAALGLFFGAPFIAGHWLDDLRALPALRIFASTLPFIALGGVTDGYFTAVQRLAKPAGVSVLAQLVRIGVTAALLRAEPQSIAFSCTAVAFGALVGEALGLFLMLLLCRADLAMHTAQRQINGLSGRILSVSLPVALSLYARMALATAENVLTPKGLRASGIAAQAALATYGVIEGMVFPVLMFPCALLSVLVELLVPELTESQVLSHRRRINYIIGRVFRFGLPFTVWVFGILLVFSQVLGTVLFQTPEAARFLRLLAPMVLLVYLDALADGMLKGLGEYAATLRFSIIDSLLGVALVTLLLPRWGVTGYLFTTMSTKAVNCALSTGHLRRVSGWQFPLGAALRSLGCILLAAFGASALWQLPGLRLAEGTVGVLLPILTATAVYAVLLCLTGAVGRGDLHWLLSVAVD